MGVSYLGSGEWKNLGLLAVGSLGAHTLLAQCFSVWQHQVHLDDHLKTRVK